MEARLSDATLTALPAAVRRPAYDRRAVTTGIVHLGPGAFFRAHVASYVDDLLASDPRWGICAVALRSRDLRAALASQDWLYSLAILDAEPELRVVGALTDVLCAADDPAAVRAALTAPATRLVTLTVTEKGYCLGSDGNLDFGHPDIVADLAGGDPASAIGWIVEGQRLRRAAGLGPATVMSCDNLSGNGARLRGAVIALADARDPALARWIAAEAHFPSTMVDSITPATDDALRTRVAGELGAGDAWPVQREAFRQWVIDDLGPDGPDLASVGATVGVDVAAFERAKLRLLNGAHSALAWLGLLSGHATVAGAMADPPLARFIDGLMRGEIAATLPPAAGLDVPAYISAIQRRFANPALAHQLAQIAWDSSQKLPYRLLGTVADTLAAGRASGRLAVAVAAWLRFVVETGRRGEALTDPLASALAEAKGPEALLAMTAVFPAALADDARFRGPVLAAFAALG